MPCHRLLIQKHIRTCNLGSCFNDALQFLGVDHHVYRGMEKRENFYFALAMDIQSDLYRFGWDILFGHLFGGTNAIYQKEISRIKNHNVVYAMAPGLTEFEAYTGTSTEKKHRTQND